MDQMENVMQEMNEHKQQGESRTETPGRAAGPGVGAAETGGAANTGKAAETAGEAETAGAAGAPERESTGAAEAAGRAGAAGVTDAGRASEAAGASQAGSCNASQAGAPKPGGSRFPTFGDLLAMLGIAFVAQILVGVLGRFVLVAMGYGGDASTLTQDVVGKIMAVLYFVSMCVTLGGVLYYRHVRGGRGRWARFSIRGLNPTLLLWAFVLIFAVGVVLEPLLRLLPEVSLEVGRGLWTMVSLIVLAPVFEELLCRGVVLGSLRERYGVTVAWLVSSLFFGVLHLQPVQVVSATVVGLVLGYVCLATDSLWPSMLLHALNNAAAYLLMILFVTPGENTSTLLIDLVQNHTLYGVIYGAAVILSALSGWMMVRTLRRMKEAEKNPAEA